MEAIKKKMQMLKVDKENALDASEEAEGPGSTHRPCKTISSQDYRLVRDQCMDPW